MSDSFGLIKGLKVTFKELFRKSVTDKYPKEFREKPQRFHGRHVLNKYEDGIRDLRMSRGLGDVYKRQGLREFGLPWS